VSELSVRQRNCNVVIILKISDTGTVLSGEYLGYYPFSAVA
jgi:hypothetical protein